MVRTLIVLGLVACGGDVADPGLAARRRALDAWERGVSSLEAGNSQEARAAFAEALDARPGDPLLVAWRAKAEAADGDLDRAVASARASLGTEPSPSIRYNLACWEARRGKLDLAAAELRTALADGARDPREVLTDPDFIPHLRDPRFSFLPAAPVTLRVRGPDGAVFLGGDAQVEVELRGRGLGDTAVVAPALRGPFVLTDVEERRRRSTDGEESVVWIWTWKAKGAGTAFAGPFSVTMSGSTVTDGGLALVALAPPDVAPPEATETPWRTPSELLVGAPTGDPVVWQAGPEWRAKLGPSDRLEGAAPTFRATWWEDRSLRGQMLVGDGSDPGLRFRIIRGGSVVWDAPASASR